MKRIELQTGFVLHSRPWRDSSLLVEFFSRQQGRVSLMAKGARGRKTRGGSTAALLQPFGRVSCSWSGRGELKTLTHCEAEALPLGLVGRRLYSALYVNELLMRLLHHEDPHEGLFDLYQQVLQALAQDGSEQVLRRFEFALLDALGYGFDLGVDGATGEPINADSWYHYRYDCGLVLAGADVSEREPRYRGSDLQRMQRGDLDGPVRQCAKQLMRQALAEHLGTRPLNSRELFRQI